MSCANSQNEYTGDGSETGYLFTFEYEQQSEVQVEVYNTTTARWDVKQQDDATYGWAFNGLAAITFNTAPADGVKFKIARNTIVNPLQATFYPGSAIRAQDLNNDFEQMQRAIEDLRCEDDTIYQYVDDKEFVEFGVSVTTEAEQIAQNVPDDDKHVLSNAAAIERHDNILSPNNPGNSTQPGKLWTNTSSERINYWNSNIGAWVDTAQSGPVGPIGPEGPDGPQGPQGDAATIAVGTTVSSAPGGDAEVTNVGTAQEAIFNFVLPRGEPGPAGGGVRYRGTIDATTQNAPADPENGDFFINTGAGAALPSWTGAGVVEVNTRLIFDLDDGQWDPIAPIGTGVNLDYDVAPTEGTVLNSSGTNATIPAATQTNAGLMTNADKAKLDGIAPGSQPGTVTSVTGTGAISMGGTATDPVVGVNTGSTTQQGVVQLSDAIDSTSTALAGTANAVRRAAELGQDGINAAATAQATAEARLPLTGGNLTGAVTQQASAIADNFPWDCRLSNIFTFAGGVLANPANAIASETGVILCTGAVTGFGNNYPRTPSNLGDVSVPYVIPYLIVSPTEIRVGNAVEV